MATSTTNKQAKATQSQLIVVVTLYEHQPTKTRLEHRGSVMRPATGFETLITGPKEYYARVVDIQGCLPEYLKDHPRVFELQSIEGEESVINMLKTYLKHDLGLTGKIRPQRPTKTIQPLPFYDQGSVVSVFNNLPRYHSLKKAA